MRAVLCLHPKYGYCFLEKSQTEIPDEDGVRQVIPYVVIINKATDRIALFRRKTGDSRLVGGYIIGVGGHVEVTDVDYRHDTYEEVINAAACREISEEIGIKHTNVDRLKKMDLHEICLSENEVDRAHYGMIFTYDTNSRSLRKVPDDELEFVGWKMKSELRGYQLESWSNYVLKEVL